MSKLVLTLIPQEQQATAAPGSYIQENLLTSIIPSLYINWVGGGI